MPSGPPAVPPQPRHVENAELLKQMKVRAPPPRLLQLLHGGQPLAPSATGSDPEPNLPHLLRANSTAYVRIRLRTDLLCDEHVCTRSPGMCRTHKYTTSAERSGSFQYARKRFLVISISRVLVMLVRV